MLYGEGAGAGGAGPRSSSRGGLGRSAPTVARWLGDIRRYFPTPVVQVAQKDAFERLGLKQMLLEPEFLAAVEADVNLVVGAGVNVIVLLALSDEGRPVCHPQLSAAVAALGAPVFACTPDQFPDLMAAALKREDIHAWAAAADIQTVRAEGLEACDLSAW
jgi:hypothetical protein